MILRRRRISAKQFWIQADHVTPDPQSVAFMSTRELKFAMMNEAWLGWFGYVLGGYSEACVIFCVIFVGKH